MKKRIIIGLAVYSVIFLLMGVYMMHVIRSGTLQLDQHIQLHQVEILREHFLIQIKRVQAAPSACFRSTSSMATP